MVTVNEELRVSILNELERGLEVVKPIEMKMAVIDSAERLLGVSVLLVHAFFLRYVSILIYHQLLTTSYYHQLLLISIVIKIIMCLPMLGVWRLGGLTSLPLHHWLVLQAKILKEASGLLQGSRSSVVRASTAKVGGLGFDSQWLAHAFFLWYVSILFYHQLLTTSYYQRLLLISIVAKITSA